MRRPLVAGNWKLHGSRAENARADRRHLLLGLPAQPPVDIASCARPSCTCRKSRRLLQGLERRAGRAGRVRRSAVGAFTGEVSAAMLKDVGCQYVIVGHSERRAHLSRRRRAGGAQVRGGAVAGADPDPVRRRDARGARGGPDACTWSRASSTRCSSCAASAALAQRGDRVRAGVGHRHRQERDARAGAGRARHHPRRGRGAGMLRSRPICGSCTAAASRPAMRRSSSRCPMWTAA